MHCLLYHLLITCVWLLNCSQRQLLSWVLSTQCINSSCISVSGKILLYNVYYLLIFGFELWLLCHWLVLFILWNWWDIFWPLTSLLLRWWLVRCLIRSTGRFFWVLICCWLSGLFVHKRRCWIAYRFSSYLGLIFDIILKNRLLNYPILIIMTSIKLFNLI